MYITLKKNRSQGNYRIKLKLKLMLSLINHNHNHSPDSIDTKQHFKKLVVVNLDDCYLNY